MSTMITTVHTVATTAASWAAPVNYAFDPIPIPGLTDRLNRGGGWLVGVVYLGCIAALVIGGGYLAWDKITDHGGGKGPKIALGAVIGAMVVASSVGIIDAARA
ncbi:hypothetical protein FOS14_19465 [Skermania sp. ID1734]|uniref:hypothetical protein n=1 Tax=Skermania sp. ID1734 TaxID=2597516 RepID=UPI00117C66FF|nr:hypothetical protein [Skermania sp. ID1734]TSD94823.1 hypothetical protein FOS14_19465 [Skermania sp. ID1734]